MRFLPISLVMISLVFGVFYTAAAEEHESDFSGTEYVAPAVNDVKDAGTYEGKKIGQNVRLINPLNTGECAPNENCLLNFLNKILDFVIRIGTVVVVLMMVYVGYLFVVAQGKEDKIREARNALLWTLIGALVLLGSQAIAKGIEATVKALSSGG